MVLREAGFEVDSYNGLRRVLSNFKVGYCDLLLTDIRMSKLNGYELYRKIKTKDDN